MGNLAFATGLMDGYFGHQNAERDRKEKNAQAAVNFLISSGRVRDYNDILPLIDQATGGAGGTGKPQGFKGGLTAGSKGKGGQDPHSILSQIMNPILLASRGTTGTDGSGGPSGSTGSTVPGQDQPAPAQPATPSAPAATPPQAGPGPLMSDAELAQRKTGIDITTNRAMNAEDVRAIRERAQQFRTDDPTMSVQDSMAAAADTLGKKWPTVRRAGVPKAIGKPVDPAEDPTAKAENGQPFASVYPGVKGMQRMTNVGPDGQVQEYYTPSAAPAEVKLPARLAESVDEELAARGIDPRTATTAQKDAALVGAGQRLKAKGELDSEAIRSLINQRTLNGKGGAASQLGAVGPKGEELPQVSIGPDGRPSPAEQAEFLAHFDHGTQAALKGLADYSISPATFSNRSTTAKGGGMTRAQITELVKQFDPSYDDKLYGQRNKTQTDWTSGKTRDSMVATNTVVKHLQELNEATKALAPFTNAILPSLNERLMTGKAEFNPKLRDAIKRFGTARQAVASELERVYRGTGGSQGDINEWRDNLSPYDATDAKQSALKTAVTLMFGRINSATDSYKASMGKNPPAGLGLTSSSLRVLRGMGIDPGGLNESQLPNEEPVTPQSGTASPDRAAAVQYLRDHQLPIEEANIQHYLESVQKKPAA